MLLTHLRVTRLVMAHRLSLLSTLTHITRSTKQLSELQEEFDTLRPLLRLCIRSVDFRNTMLSMLKIGKEVMEEEDTQPEQRDQDLDQLMRHEEKFRVVRRATH